MSTQSKAEQVWRTWHQKNPRELHEVEYDFPEEVFSIGLAETIIYASDKWEDDGDFYDYVHEHETGAEVFTTDGTGRRASVKSLLGTRQDLKTGELSLPMLGMVKELIVMPHDADAKHSLKFKEKPILSCSLDRKTLIIFSESKGPIFVRGGRMVVTERGIVG